MAETLEISDDALKLMVAEHGIRGTARLLQMDERQTMAFRQRAQRQKWMQDPAIAAIRAKSSVALTGRPSAPIVSAMSPQAAIQAEIASHGQRSRAALARSITKAAEHVETLDGQAILGQSSDVKSIAQTADLVHGWKDQAPSVKIRLDVLGAAQEQPLIDVSADVTPCDAWDYEDELDSY